MTQPLPHYLDVEAERVAFEARLARLLLELGEPAPAPQAFRGVTSGGDERRLRGLPAIARGTSGAIAGTDPLREVLRRERQNGRGRP